MTDGCALTATMHATPAEALQAVERAFQRAHVFVTEAHQLDSKIPVPAVPG